MLSRLFGLVLAGGLLLASEGDAQLPPAMKMDLHEVEAERHIESGDYAAAKAALDRILDLQAAHDVALPEAFWFKYAQVARQAGLYAEAVEAVTRYLTTAGREGAHYRAALELLDRATIAAEAAQRLAQFPREVRNSLGMEFVLIEPGSFLMGSPATESGRWDDEGPVHEVTLSEPFYMGKYEVTQGQWEAVMGSNPSKFNDCGRRCPVEQMFWWDAEAFIVALNRSEGVNVYRLPTEAEWEYAARGRGQPGGYWYDGNSGNRTHPVGLKRPNGWGLYDMLGNVGEWTADWYGPYSIGPVTDPRGPSEGSARVTRGGTWDSTARYCRAAYRHGVYPGLRVGSLGFRLARTP